MKKQAGFTLIELIVVIVILGILSAVALPKFASLQSDARIATLEGVEAAMWGVSSIAHAKSLIDGNEDSATGTTVTFEDTSSTNMVFGYPDAADICDVLNLQGDLAGACAAGVVTVQAGCTATYANAALNGNPSVTLATGGC